MRRPARWSATAAVILTLFGCLKLQAQSPEEFEALKKRVEKLESSVFPRAPIEFLTVRNGKLFEGDKEFRAWAVSIVGYAVVKSTPQQVDACLDHLALSNIRLIRILHLDSTIGSGTPMWFDPATTMKYDEKVLSALDYFIDGCRKRNLRVWLNLCHRRILTDQDGPETPFGRIAIWDKLFGPRGGGLRKGEIRSLAFFDDALESLLKEHARKLFDRVNTVNGLKYKHDATIAVATFINEATATRPEAGYSMQDRTGLDTNSFKKATFDRWDAFNARATGTPDNPAGTLKGTKHDLQKFYADLDYQFFSRCYADLRESGVKAILNGSASYGASTMTSLCGQIACDLMDIHIYPEGADELDPLDPAVGEAAAARSLGSAVSASRFFGKPLAVSEWGSVFQQGPLARSPSGSWLIASEYVAKVGADQGVSILCQYAWQSHILGSPTANNEAYDSGRDPDFVVSFVKGGNRFREGKEFPLVFEMKATAADLFGSGTGTMFNVPRIGSQQWAIENAGKLQVQVKLPVVPELPWLK